MKVSASIVLAAALGVSAHPHGATHPHVHRDTNLEVRDQFVKNVRPTTTVFQTVTVPAANKVAIAAATSTVASAPAATTSKASSGGTSGTIGTSGKYKDDFCSGASKRATLDEIEYGGNVGTPYGCVLKFVDQSAAKDYQYVSVLENASSEKQACACFLKKGPTNQMDGFWKGKQVHDFTLDAGESKYLAIQDGAIGGCSCGVGSLPTTSFGQIAGTWLEFEVGSWRNIGFSGADASSLVPEDDGKPFQGMTISLENPEFVGGHEKKSIIYPNGDGCNAFPHGTKLADGYGFNIGNSAKGADPIRLHVKWGTGGSLSDCPEVKEGNKLWRQTRA